MKLDSHNHYWNYDPVELDWMDADWSLLQRDYLPDEHKSLLNSIDFDGTIVIEARQILKENDYLLDLAQQNDFIKGIVGWVDLRSKELIRQLETYASHSKFSGVRHVVLDEPDIDFYIRDNFIDGIKQLKDFNLTYDLLNRSEQLPAAIGLVKQCPNQPFVLDHIGFPNIKDKVLSPWREELIELSNYDNVMCKLSGLPELANWNQWQPDDFRIYLDIAFEAFGEDRLMIGSNWPVCQLAGDYTNIMNIVIDYIKQFPQTTQDKILGSNCARFYGVK